MSSPKVSLSLRVVTGLLALMLSTWAVAEPPMRAARLGYISGTVSFSPGSDPDWAQAVVNRPLTTGDSLWADTNSRAELQIGGASIRLGGRTNVTLLNLDDNIAQLQLQQGSIKLHVRHLGPDQSFEIDTPNLAFTLRRAGDYRIDVDPDGNATAVRVHSGLGEVYGQGASYSVDAQQGYRFYGTDLTDYDTLAAQPDDDFDRWALTRDRREDGSQSARYVSPDVVGYEDLDSNGTWRNDPNYGNVWTPNRVAVGWTPYRDGHWAWVDPWGWTWVDDAPWGFAVSHYGRWANISGRWGWVPGPVRERAVYAPALVAFVGGNNLAVSVSVGGAAAAAVGWFPLAPREVYQPTYPVSRVYFDSVNRSNAVLAPAVITNVYNTTVVNNRTTIVNNNTTTINNITKVVYVNQHVTGAVVAVPAQAFAQSQSVARAAVPVSAAAAVSARVVPVAAVVPLRQSLHGGAPDAGTKPPKSERAVVARTAPPPAPIAFAVQQQQLAEKPGAVIDEERRKRLTSAAPAAAAPKVSVVTAAHASEPTARPPAVAPAVKTPEARKAQAVAAAAGTGATVPGRSDPAKANPTKPEAAKADEATAEAGKKAEAARSASARAEASKLEAARSQSAPAAPAAPAASAEAERAARAASARAEAERAGNARAEAVKAQAERSDAQRGAAAQAQAQAQAQAEALRRQAAKNEAAKNEAAKNEAATAEVARAAHAKAEAARVEAARAKAKAKAEAVPPTAPIAHSEHPRPPAGEAPPAKPRPPASKQESEEEKKKRGEEETRNR